MINYNNLNNYSSRNRRCQKQPVYTSDKRAKFTQRENKKWIRFLTVLGYIFFVSLPALSLSVYYIYMWDPGYIHKVTQNESGAHPAKYFDTIKTDRPGLHSTGPPTMKAHVLSTAAHEESVPMDVHLADILKEGAKSMESSHETIGTT